YKGRLHIRKAQLEGFTGETTGWVLSCETGRIPRGRSAAGSLAQSETPCPLHHSGSGQLARPYPVKDLHLLSFCQLSWRTPSWVIRVDLALAALTRRRIDAFRSPIWPRRKKPTPSDTGKRFEGGAAMPEWQRRILRTFAVRSRPIAHGYDPLTARPIRGEPVLVRAANRQPRRQL